MTIEAEPPAVTESLVDGRIGQLRFANPARRHALSIEVLNALTEGLGLPIHVPKEVFLCAKPRRRKGADGRPGHQGTVPHP